MIVAKPQKKANRVHQQMLAGLIETKPVSYTKKTLGRDREGKEIVVNQTVTYESLRYPLAQNVSDENVERAARRWR